MSNDLFAHLEAAPAGTRTPLSDVLDALNYTADGLIPAIAQEQHSGEVLMFAWMNRAAIDETLATGRVCYFSRSRQRLWRKGEESGNVQSLVDLRIDCDGDVLLLTVTQRGPACHTGRRSCFYLRREGADLLITSEPDVDPARMYTRAD